jgi:hypothetical protein
MQPFCLLFSPNSIKKVVFVVEARYDFCDVETEFPSTIDKFPASKCSNSLTAESDLHLFMLAAICCWYCTRDTVPCRAPYNFLVDEDLYEYQ